MNPDDLWSPFESVATNYDELVQCINGVCNKAQQKELQFAWRGQRDASWGLFSSLHRRLRWTRNTALTEKDIFTTESDILKEVHRWGLHMSPAVGRMSILHQLATLQHYGAPTRLIDVTFNPWIAAWFCVENTDTECDARLFAIDVTDRLINEQDELRAWEDCLIRPWPIPPEQFEKVRIRRGHPSDDESKRLNNNRFKEWTTSVYAWKPPHINNRIAAQNGAFIFGGVPAGTDHKLRVPKGPEEKAGKWSMEEVRACTSIARRPHKLDYKRGSIAKNPTYTIRIKASARNDLRKRLEENFGYKHSTIYPDYTGFAQFGKPKLRSRPPAREGQI
ncbi:FRG domain-containing protein [Pelagicoccus enzymogenes]|uniref:FRG domain-containing protein n=1 Tax=Pelagicoccus enzymogenes TaxID=2773457 RepID=UPI00280EF672|nr:FRG domain-containing protein [Pelagicoccus enzymogenes]MDQ8197472.1 FRG domain-containing protein [Pelagicoccus enzymogenes]